MSKDFFKKIYLSLYLKGSCVWEGAGDRTELQYIDPHSLGLLNRGAWGPLHWMLFSLSHLVINSSDLSGVPRAPSGGWWLPLPHLVSNSSDLKLTDFLSSPSYIIIQSPTQYLWNGMFDRHQAEITVMQFTGHSLPVHQSMSVPWDFTLSHFFSQVRLRNFFS